MISSTAHFGIQNDKLNCLNLFKMLLVLWVTTKIRHIVGGLVPDIHATFHNQPFIMRRAIWRHVLGHTDSYTHSHIIEPPTAGVQLVGHTSNTIIIVDGNNKEGMVFQ